MSERVDTEYLRKIGPASAFGVPAVEDRLKIVRAANELDALRAAKEELLEAIRLTQEYAQLPAFEGWTWYDVYRRDRPADAERLRKEWERECPACGEPGGPHAKCQDEIDRIHWRTHT